MVSTESLPLAQYTFGTIAHWLYMLSDNQGLTLIDSESENAQTFVFYMIEASNNEEINPLTDKLFFSGGLS